MGVKPCASLLSDEQRMAITEDAHLTPPSIRCLVGTHYGAARGREASSARRSISKCDRFGKFPYKKRDSIRRSIKGVERH
jgi:hypothetical protein